MGNPEAMKALLDKVADELVLNDEFFITDNEACIDKIEGSMLVRFDSEALRQSNAEKDRMEEERMEAFSASRKEVVFLKNRIATLSNRLISAGLDPT